MASASDYQRIRDLAYGPYRANPMSFVGKESRHLSRALLESSDVVQKGLARLGPGNELLSSITGEVAGSTVREALSNIRATRAEEMAVFTGIPGIDFPAVEENKVLSEMISNINFGLSGTRSSDLDFIPAGKQLEMVKFNFSGVDESTRGAFDNIAALMGHKVGENDLAPGLVSVRDGSATMLSFRYETESGKYAYLTGEEAISLTNRYKAGFFNPSAIVKAFDPDLDTPAEFKVGSFFQKSDKRITASTSGRNFVVGQDDVDTILNRIGTEMTEEFAGASPMTLSQSWLTYDGRLETVLKGFGLESEYTDSLLKSISDPVERLAMQRQRQGANIIMSSLSQDYLSGTMKAYMGGEENYEKFGQLIRQSFEKSRTEGNPFRLKDLTSLISEKAKDTTLSDADRAVYRRMGASFDEMKRITDGSSVMGVDFFRHHAEELTAKIDNAQAQLLPERMSSLDPASAQKLKASVTEWKKQLSQFVDPSGKIKSLDDQTLRVLMEGDIGQVKAVTDIMDTDVTRALAKLGYIGAGSNELLKGEVTLGRAAAEGLSPGAGQAVTMSMFSGRPNEAVVADLQGLIFHREVYGSQLAKEVRKTRQFLESDLEQFKSSGTITSRVKRSIDRAASISVDDWENLNFKSYSNAARYRDNALQLQSRLLSGENPRNIPELANQIVDISAREHYRGIAKQYRTIGANGREVTETLSLPNLPFSNRSAIDTEFRYATAGQSPAIGEAGAEFSTKANISLKGGQELDMFRYRFAGQGGHKMIVGDRASALGLGMYESAGGFDLDDKFITNLHYVTDSENNRRLVSFAWRQPTGPQEFALMAPVLDDATIRRTFGSDNLMGDRFRRLTEAVSEEISMDKFGRISTVANPASAEEIVNLSNEEKIIKYINSLVNGNTKAANMYKPVGMQQEEVEKAIVSLLRVGEGGKERI
jgi:hypothetical protein